MYNSLIPWVDVPCTVKTFLKRNGTGVKEFSDTSQTLCYPEEKNEVVKNSQGKEIVSSTRLYMFGSDPIKELDEIDYDGYFREVVAVAAFFRKGVKDVKVVYL